VVRELVDVHYPKAQKIVLVMDNLNTHKPASLYETFEPQEAKRLIDKLEIHYTPKHGSWLNIAEIELGVMIRQCLNRRIPDINELTQEVQAWVQERNTKGGTVDWQFTIEGARTKLKHLYPSINI
jgi:transposase